MSTDELCKIRPATCTKKLNVEFKDIFILLTNTQSQHVQTKCSNPAKRQPGYTVHRSELFGCGISSFLKTPNTQYSDILSFYSHMALH